MTVTFLLLNGNVSYNVSADYFIIQHISKFIEKLLYRLSILYFSPSVKTLRPQRFYKRFFISAQSTLHIKVHLERANLALEHSAFYFLFNFTAVYRFYYLNNTFSRVGIKLAIIIGTYSQRLCHYASTALIWP